VSPKPFVFRLQKVLDYRIRIEDQRKAELAELEARRSILVAERVRFEQEQARTLGRMMTTEFDLVDLQLSRLYVERLDRDIARKREEIAVVAQRIEAKREELIAASQARRAMERLREKQEAEYMLGMLRAEQKILDEMGTTGFHRNRVIEAVRRGAEA
jgi:flagellar protein FliJ